MDRPRADLLKVPEDRLRLLRFYLPEGLPALPGHALRPGDILLLKPGTALPAPEGKGRNLVFCLDARLRIHSA